MELSFEKTSFAEMLFILFSLKRELSGDAYCSILQQQNDYLENHRNISIVGIGILRMIRPARYQDEVFSLRTSPSIQTRRLPSLLHQTNTRPRKMEHLHR
jgi:hypothetical protein